MSSEAPSPSLTFFVELEVEPLAALLSEPVLATLRAAGAGVAMAMLDLSAPRREAIAELNRRGIPVTAWLVLGTADGYWLTADNADLAAARYVELRAWADEHALLFDAVGLDIESPHADALALVQYGGRALQRMLRRRRSRRVLREAQARYATLVQAIRADGYRVESYQLPLVVDERRARSTLLQRTFGLVNLGVDREVLMLYQSLLPAPWGEALVDGFGAEADGVAVGLTGGGVEFLHPVVGGRWLTLEQLVTNLRRARRYTPQLYVFSLEGCVQQGYLEALCRADLTLPVAPAPAARAVTLLRSLLRAALLADPLWGRVKRTFGIGQSAVG
ncbi:MAG: hypothetical protein IT371_28795 [Deltaproteobacteria bacterium]|nr:hypothetical protein [Deltaproteobacteria bacterium]